MATVGPEDWYGTYTHSERMQGGWELITIVVCGHCWSRGACIFKGGGGG